MITNEDFLKTYKNLENELRNNSDYAGVKDYEDSLTDLEVQDRLRFARNLRNYLSHHSDGDKLISINKGMISFLNEQTDIILKINGIVQDAYTSIAKSEHLLKLTDDYKTCKDVLQAMSKKKSNSAYILNKTGELLGELSIYDLINVVTDSSRAGINKLPVKAVDIPDVQKQTPLTSLDTGYYLVKDSKGKICGDLIIN